MDDESPSAVWRRRCIYQSLFLLFRADERGFAMIGTLPKRGREGKGADILMTNPAKKALIQLMIKVCGTIIAIFPFIIPIIPSIAAGSVIGFGAAFPLFPGSLRKAPSLYAVII